MIKKKKRKIMKACKIKLFRRSHGVWNVVRSHQTQNGRPAVHSLRAFHMVNLNVLMPQLMKANLQCRAFATGICSHQTFSWLVCRHLRWHGVNCLNVALRKKCTKISHKTCFPCFFFLINCVPWKRGSQTLRGQVGRGHPFT